ncbi:hypothetical protein IG193_02780 [Infirmifilum lucidum]|uniref:Bacterial repeat domain-containing protein n=1 Tax=Infirmifilum lucidum TaxID=2776706 RepID=A0A7L9FKE1_9CREN|nr:hypothetical protein [Infirmifilum lucidum]QOJ79404.1 hypothetical protein IG193_02780 [Infirmifilum lucidum]
MWSRRAQASALGAVFLTIVLVLAAVVLVQYMRSQTELQAIASQVQAQRAGEGALTFSVNDTYATSVSGNNSPISLRVNVLNGTSVSTGTLEAPDGKGLLLTPTATSSGYLLRVNVSVSVPLDTVNLTQGLYLRPSATICLEIYTKTSSGSYAFYTAYILPANATSSVQVTSTNYILSVLHPKNFTLLFDRVQTNLTRYNATGFYLKIVNRGPGYTALYGLWVVTSTAAKRMPLNAVLPPGGVLPQIPVQPNSSSVNEVRVTTSTRVYILRPTPPRLLGGAAPPAAGTLLIAVYPPGSGTTNPPPGTYTYPLGSQVTVTANPSTGYAFKYWLLNGTVYSSSQTVTVTVTSFVNLTAVFQPALPPKFVVLSYNTTVTGAVSSQQRLVVTVNNTGQSTGVAQVEVYDQSGNLVNSTQVTVPPATPQQAVVVIKLPSTRGTYTWTIKVKNLATGNYDDVKTFTVIARDIFLQSRSAIVYEDFESSALPSGWTQLGGTWSTATGGWRGYALSGSDNSQGPGGDSIFANNTQLPATIYAVVKLGNVKVDYTYRGFGLLDSLSTTAFFYEVSISPVSTSYLYLYIWRFTGNWRPLKSTTAAYTGTWYTLYLVFTRGPPNTITAVLYDSSGNQLATVSASDSVVKPSYIGLAVDGSSSTLFDDVVVATGDPRYVTVTGLQQGWSVLLVDFSGNTVARAIADSTGVARLWVLNSSVLRDATIRVLDSSGSTVIQKTFPVVIGGDTYSYG